MKNTLLFLLGIGALLGLAACGGGGSAPRPEPEVKKDSPKVYVKTVPEWSASATMYEVNLRQFSPEGTLAAFRKEMPRLKELGIDILWFMPIHPIGVKNRKGSQGSYYSVRDYQALHPDYGTLDEFKALVQEAHALGMKVIIDWVANHSAFDNVWVEQGHKDWYTLDSTGNLQPPIGTDWWDVADLNFDNQDMRRAMIQALQFWVRECDIDGYRCDVADWVPTDFWEQARQALDSIKPVFMLAEAENPEHHLRAFDASYAWEFHFIMNDIAQGKKSVAAVREYLRDKAPRFAADAYRLHFTSNHDENSWKGTEFERLGAAVKTFAVLAATMEGMPLVYNGQEAGLNKRLQFFEKDPIVWKDWSMSDFYKKLLALKHDNRALWNGSYGGGAPRLLSPESDTLGLAFVRSRESNAVLCLFNLSKKEQTLRFDASEWAGKHREWFSGQETDLTAGELKLKPWEYRVYTRK